MTRAEAYEHIAAVMSEWWPHLGYTPEEVAKQFDLRERNEKFVKGTEMWYPFFAMDVLEASGVLE
ncbi:MAG: hypothetical protein ICV64_06640 [Thermoleophilia bacterium]|nr:hypothetical protein [Thermoleophilia bacterium]